MISYNTRTLPQWCNENPNIPDVEEITIAHGRKGGAKGNGKHTAEEQEDLSSKRKRTGMPDMTVPMYAGFKLWQFTTKHLVKLRELTAFIKALPQTQASAPNQFFWNSFGCPYLGGINCFICVGHVQIAEFYEVCYGGDLNVYCNPRKNNDEPKKRVYDLMNALGFVQSHRSFLVKDPRYPDVMLSVPSLCYTFDASRWNANGYRLCSPNRVGEKPRISTVKVVAFPTLLSIHSPSYPSPSYHSPFTLPPIPLPPITLHPLPHPPSVCLTRSCRRMRRPTGKWPSG